MPKKKKATYKTPEEKRRIDRIYEALEKGDKVQLENATRTYHRGDIYYVYKDPAECVGSEYHATGRPCVIVSNDEINLHSPVIMSVYLTTKQKMSIPEHVKIRLHKTPSTVLCEQITAIDKTRFGSFARSCTVEEMEKIDKALKSALSLRGGDGQSAKSKSTKSSVAPVPATIETPVATIAPVPSPSNTTAEANAMPREKDREVNDDVRRLTMTIAKLEAERNLLRELYESLTCSVISKIPSGTPDSEKDLFIGGEKNVV